MPDRDFPRADLRQPVTEGREEIASEFFGAKTLEIIKDRKTHQLTRMNFSEFGTPPGTVIKNQSTDVLWTTLEWQDGFNHPGFRNHSRNPRMDIGGDWTKFDVSVSSAGQEAHLWTGTGNSRNDWNGFVYANPSTYSILSHQLVNPLADEAWFVGMCPPAKSPTELDTFGANAIAAVKPTNPASKTLTAIAELVKDGLPSLPGTGPRAGNVGDEYLNLQFAWLPTVSDGRSFIQALHDHDRTISQYRRDDGKLVRRSYQGGETVDATSATTSTGVAPIFHGVSPTTALVSTGTRKVYSHTTTRLWFDGAFTYHIPNSVFGRRIAELNKAYGLAPNFSTEWALTPWSWLFDWFTNAREVMGNLDAFVLYGQVMPWGYVMCEQIQTVSSTWEGLCAQGGTRTVPLIVRDVYTTKTLQRRKATPYGFGLDWNGFNLFQLAILAALGISRVL